MLSRFGKMLELFPFSKLSKRGPILRVHAIALSEPPLIEREFLPEADPAQLIDGAREFLQNDCACEIDGFWDLWQFEGEWKLAPAAVTLSCFGPLFENEDGDHMRIEFGLAARFLPAPHIEGGVLMAQSNIRSLLHLVGELERRLKLERRTLWSESGVNFAELLKQVLGTINVN